MFIIEALYTVAALMLAIYGFNALLLALVAILRPARLEAPPKPDTWPGVTVQLPIYNEIHVVTRLLHAVAHFDYPRDRLEIQVLDDSDDETARVVHTTVQHLRRLGMNIHHVRRAHRHGYKAGALDHGLRSSQGELIAIFDADFVPPPDWLRRTVPYLVHDPRLGFVQTRWEHLNADTSPITLAQTLALDGHFAVEQVGRQALGWPLTFNGSAGLWRRSCIEGSGGWHDDTVCEDLDLAYRAQLAGWKGKVVPHIAAAGEVPPLIDAFRRQQSRWATGSMQALRKHARSLLRTSALRLDARIQGLLHLSNYLVHPLMVMLLVLTLPLMLMEHPLDWPMAYLSLAGLGPPLAYAVAQWRLRGHGRRLIALPMLVFLGIGIAWAGTRAVWRGLTSRRTPFERTPKFRLEGEDNTWPGKRYGEETHAFTWGEWVLAVYALAAAAIAWHKGNVFAVPFLLLYATSFLTVAVGVWWQARQHRKARLRALSRPSPHGFSP